MFALSTVFEDGLHISIRKRAAGPIATVYDRFSGDRLDYLLLYNVLRNFVDYGQLTVPIRDLNLEGVEANQVGERVKAVWL